MQTQAELDQFNHRSRVKKKKINNRISVQSKANKLKIKVQNISG